MRGSDLTNKLQRGFHCSYMFVCYSEISVEKLSLDYDSPMKVDIRRDVTDTGTPVRDTYNSITLYI